MKFWKNKNILISLVTISVVVLFTFWDLPKTFYQQDEWQTLGHNLAEGIGIFANTSPLQFLFGELRPLSGLMYLILMGFYKFTVVPTAIFGIIFQIINSLLTFYIADKITKNKLVAFISALFLITNSVSHQAVTWASAIGTLPAVTLILVSILMCIEYLDTSNKRYLFLSFISAILSLYFKGIGLFLFVLLPLMFFTYKEMPINKKNIKAVLGVNLPFLTFGLLMILVRFIQVFFSPEKVVGYASGAGNNNFFQTIILHLILYPLTSLFQIFVPPLDLYSITPAITKMQYKFLVGSPLVDLVAQSIVADMMAILGSIAILGFVLYKYKDKIINRNILFALVFFFLTFIPYVALDRDSSYLSSRYFYLGAVPAGILFGYAVYFLININKYLKWIILLFVALFLFHHASIVKGDINYQVNLGDQRKAVLTGIKSNYPNIADKNIFFVTSDKGFYGDITNPFQNGLGYVLEVYYYGLGSDKIPKSFLTDNFLWDLGAEGYKEEDGKGFGYFQDMDKMVLAIEKNKLSKGIVHAFLFDSKTNKIENITDQTRARLATISAILK